MKKILFTLALLSTTNLTFAMEDHTGHNMKEHDHNHEGEAPAAQEIATERPASVTAKVNGLVCDFCARAVEKVFRKNEAVEDISVNLEDKTVLIWFNEGKTIDDATLTKMITDSGYNLVSLEREDS